MKTLLLAASALTMFVAVPAMAQNADVQTETQIEADAKTGWESTKEATANAWDKTKEAVTEAADSVAESSEKAYEETAKWLDTNTDIDAYVDNETRFTVDDIEGMNVYNSQNQKIGDVTDIMLDNEGDIEKLVVTSGGLLGLGGDTVAVDYESMTMEATGDNAGFHTNLTEAELKAMGEFDKNTVTGDMYLTSNLVGARVVNSDMKEIAKVDSIIIEGDEASKLVVSYNGDKPTDSKGLVDYDDASIVMNKDQNAEFKLSVQ